MQLADNNRNNHADAISDTYLNIQKWYLHFADVAVNVANNHICMYTSKLVRFSFIKQNNFKF